MTTPIINLTSDGWGYKFHWGSYTSTPLTPETGDTIEVDADDYIPFRNAPAYLKIVPSTEGFELDGVFRAVPAAAAYKLNAAWLYEDDDVDVFIGDITKKVIVSTDGRIVFKPDFIRMIRSAFNEFDGHELADDKNYYVQIFITAMPAYTNPSEAPVDPIVNGDITLVIKFAGATIYEAAAFSPIDEFPYIPYSDSTFDEASAI